MIDYLTPIYVFGGLIFGAFVLTKFLNYRKVVVVQKSKQTNAIVASGQNPLNKFDSFHDLLTNLEQGLDKQVQEIAAACSKENKNPMDDTGYTTVLNQYQTVNKWRVRFESPVYSILDSVGYPVVRSLGADFIKNAPKLLRGIT